MKPGVIMMHRPGVPADAPPPAPGETPWFSGDQQPVKIGVYKRLSMAGLVVYSMWDGDHWLRMHCSATGAVRASSSEPSLCQTLPWCGLLRPPAQGYGPLPGDSEGGEPC